ncbi:TonB-dependent receptor [uncultured Bacteroides sp.]|uniref:SusC/RagA family TonB-linked outer membrane protein n=1 Tax=uncultured Bacteroides sp. TaxID=162156 RepID=UPI0025F4D6FE|nr:TonB-dependent receptor [uncultured Bacteroides sp.]
MKNNLNFKRTWLCMMAMLLFAVFPVFAQNTTVKGKVVDDTGEPIIGVNITVVGNKSLGAITNLDGNFTLSVPANATLDISFIGYKTQTIKLNGKTSLHIVLKEDAEQLDEVVVIGYGTQKKATLTGAVAAISNEELTLTKNVNTQNMLTGKLPGLRVIQKTSEPGEFTNQFDIRGLGSPLFIVDGVPRNDFPRMDANDIESISTLKDASAAIYGVRAANGVVLVTTKSGKVQKAAIEYTGYYGIQTPAEILDPIGAYDRALLFNETTMRSTTNPTKTYDAQQLQDILDGKVPDTDWYGAILRNTAPQQQHNISIRGGNKTVDYYVNVGYNNQGSFFQTNSSKYERYNVRTNLNFNVIDHLKASVRLNYIQDRTRRQNIDTWQIFSKLWRSKPTDPIFANNTAPYYNHPTSGDIENVVPLIHPELSGHKDNKKDIFQSNFSLNYDFPFVKGLSANFMFSYDKTFNDNSNFQKEYNEYTYNEVSDSYDVYTRRSPTSLNRHYDTGFSRLWNASLNFERTFIDVHHVNAMLLYEESYSQDYNLEASRYFSIPIPYLFAGDSENQVGTGSGLNERANKALVGRLQYEYGGKYLANFSFRYDGSSLFPKGKQWGFFPSIELGYRISEEAFIKDNLSWLDNLKIRGSWGRLGDDSAGKFQFIEGFDYPSGGRNYNNPPGYVFGSSFVNGLGFRNAPNMDITWFTATMKNIGLDADMWNGLLGFSFDVFQRDRDGLLDTPSIVVPGTFGTGLSQANLNADRTKGFELELRHRNSVNRNFSYNATGFVSMTRSMLTKKVQPSRSNSYDYWRNNVVGRYNDIWWGKEAAGSYQNYDEIANSIYSNSGTLPGDPIYEDWNGDGVIDSNDDHPIATTVKDGDNNDFQNKRNYPLMNFALTLGAQYKWFDISVQFQGSAMSYVSYGEQLYEPLAWDGNALPVLFDRWHPVDPDVDPYNPTTQWISGRYPYGKMRAEVDSKFNIQNGAYVRLKNMEVGFTVPKNIVTDKLKINNIRLFVNAYNLFTITGVEGLDPERPTELYGYMYPLNRTFNFGGTIKF